MQRHLCIKLLSRSPRIASSSSVTNGFTPKPLLSSSLLTINANQARDTCSHTTLLHIWGVPAITLEFWPRIQLGHSTLVTPVFSRRIFSGTLLKGNGRAFHSFDTYQNRGWKSYFRRLTADGVVIGLIAANAAVFILWRVASPQFMVKNFMVSLDNFTSGRVHTLITSAFSHRDMWHLISNMVGLYFFGLSIGRTFGPEYLLKLYLSGALVGSIFYLGYHAFLASQYERKSVFGLDPAKAPGLGASGAVNAILLLDIFLFPTKTLLFDFIIPIPAILFGIFIIGKDVLRILEHDQQISGSAHLGGATVAAIAWAKLRKGRFRRF